MTWPFLIFCFGDLCCLILDLNFSILSSRGDLYGDLESLDLLRVFWLVGPSIEAKLFFFLILTPGMISSTLGTRGFFSRAESSWRFCISSYGVGDSSRFFRCSGRGGGLGFFSSVGVTTSISSLGGGCSNRGTGGFLFSFKYCSIFSYRSAELVLFFMPDLLDFREIVRFEVFEGVFKIKFL